MRCVLAALLPTRLCPVLSVPTRLITEFTPKPEVERATGKRMQAWLLSAFHTKCVLLLCSVPL